MIRVPWGVSGEEARRDKGDNNLAVAVFFVHLAGFLVVFAAAMVFGWISSGVCIGLVLLKWCGFLAALCECS